MPTSALHVHECRSHRCYSPLLERVSLMIINQGIFSSAGTLTRVGLMSTSVKVGSMIVEPKPQLLLIYSGHTARTLLAPHSHAWTNRQNSHSSASASAAADWAAPGAELDSFEATASCCNKRTYPSRPFSYCFKPYLHMCIVICQRQRLMVGSLPVLVRCLLAQSKQLPAMA